MGKKAKPVTFEDHVWIVILAMEKGEIMPIEAIQKIVSFHEEFIERGRI